MSTNTTARAGSASSSMRSMSPSRFIRSCTVALFVFTIASTAGAQTADAVFARAKQLVVNGNGAAGRLLVDSVITATPPDTPAYAEALYWRAALAATSADAERDYRRIVVEYPASPRAADALFQLAQFEVARGDRASATGHLQRFLVENPTNADRDRASMQLVRLLFEQNDLAHGCSVLRRALSELPANAVETHNQLDYYSPRCVASDVGPGGRMPPPGEHMPVTGARDSTKRDSTKRDSTKRDSTRRDSTRRDSASASANAGRGQKSKSKVEGKFTLQIAAYKAKSDADALVKRLKARDLDARLIGTSKLFRVRIGRYATRAAAVTAQKELKARKINAFVTEIGADDK